MSCLRPGCDQVRHICRRIEVAGIIVHSSWISSEAHLPSARRPEALRPHSHQVVGVGALEVLRHLPHPALRNR